MIRILTCTFLLSFSFLVPALAAPIHGEVNWNRYEDLGSRLSGVNQRLLAQVESVLEVSKNSKTFILSAGDRAILEGALSIYVLELHAMYLAEVKPSFHLDNGSPDEYFIRLAMKALFYSDVVTMLNRLFESPSVVRLLETDLEPESARKFVPRLLSKISRELRSKGPVGVTEIKQRSYMSSSPTLATFVSYLDKLNPKLRNIKDKDLRRNVATVLSSKLDLFFSMTRQLGKKGRGGFKNTDMGRLIYKLKSNVLYVSGTIWIPKRFAITKEILEGLEPDFQPGDVALIRHDQKLTNLGLRGEWSHSVLYMGSPDKMNTFFNGDRETVNHYRSLCIEEKKNCSTFMSYLELTYPDEMAVYLAKREYDKLSDLDNLAIESRGDGVVFSDLYRSLLKDQLAVFSPRLPVRERALAIESAIQHYGKPYDFDFDLRTDGRLVCTELIYNGYSKNPANNQRGIDWVTSVAVGQPLMFGEDIAKTFFKHLDAGKPQLDLVTFIKPNPRTREYVPLGAEELRETIH